MNYSIERLESVATVIRGVSFGSQSSYDEGREDRIAILRAGNIQQDLITDSDLIFVDSSRVSLRQLIKKNDIAMCMSSGSSSLVGKSAFAFEDYHCSVGAFCGIIRPKNNIWPRFLFHFLNSNKFKRWTQLSQGVNIKNIKQSELKDFFIPVPSPEEQRRIATILDKADAIRRKRQEALKLADALVKSQFIEMFGDWNEIGRWPCVQIAAVADVTVGVVIKPAQYYTDASSGIRAFRSLNVGEMRVRDDDWVYFTPDGHKANRKSELKTGDVLIVRSGYPGTSCVVTDEYQGCNAIDVIIARPNIDAIDPVYLCAFTNFTHGKHQIQAKTGGAAQQHFNVGAYKDMTISLPPLPLQNQFTAFVEQADKSKFAMQRQLEEANASKSALMQRFFN